MKSALFLFLVITSVCFLSPGVRCDCTKISSCSCQSPEGVIDLTPLDGKSAPKFQDQTATSGGDYVYSWNPCSPFSELGGCTSVSGCQVSSDKTSSYPLGTQDSATFKTDPTTGLLTVEYQATDGTGGVRQLIVGLVCDATSDPGKLNVVGEDTIGVYSMALVSVHCCPKGGPAGGSSGGLSIGSILSIGFFALLVVYVGFGLVIQKFVRKATGPEIIPNFTFWSALPKLIKDGVMFTFSCGRKRGYDKV